jgi:asparagine synthase (glutamine-hydrolysing)
MCGIAGWVSWNKKPSMHLVEAMTNRMHHRGPDFGNVVDLGPMILGHRRLSIVDHNPASNQPMQSACGNYWLVFNGEIYNFKDIRARLESSGVGFKTNSDSEVLIEAFKKWHVDCIPMLNGMFAFAIWDSYRQTLFLVRDRVGEKPLFYGEDGFGGIIFASELNSMRLHGKFNSQINFEALNQFLTLNYVTGSESMVSGVSKLLPGTYLEIKNSKITHVQYWDLAAFYNKKSVFQNERQAAEELGLLIDDATRIRMIADVPVGAFLSGGIDSASIVSAMQRSDIGHSVKTFSMGFQERGYSESKEAKFTANFLDVEHHEMVVGKNLPDEFIKIVEAMDEPVADTSFIPFYYLSKFARKKIIVSLSGDGGDELLGGYETYVADKLHNHMHSTPSQLIYFTQLLINKLMPIDNGKVSFDYKLRKFLAGHKLSSNDAHNSWRSIFSSEDKLKLVNMDYQNKILSSNPFTYFKKQAELVSECHYLDRAMYVDTKTWLPDDILAKVDRATMAHSLENRAPFLDHRIIEFCASLPVNLKLNGFNKKYLLKKSQEAYLPKEVLHRKKRGFNAPVSKWMLGEMRDLMFEVTTGKELAEYFKTSEIKSLWSQHLAGAADNSYKLFGLTCLGIWLRKSK